MDKTQGRAKRAFVVASTEGGGLTLAKGGPVSDAEEEAICEALEGGMSQTQAAKEFDRSPSTINRIAKDHGLFGEYSEPKNAVEVHKYRALEARLDLLSDAMDKGRHLLEMCETGRDFQAILTGLAIAMDKFSQAEGPKTGDSGGEILAMIEELKRQKST